MSVRAVQSTALTVTPVLQLVIQSERKAIVLFICTISLFKFTFTFDIYSWSTRHALRIYMLMHDFVLLKEEYVNREEKVFLELLSI